MFIRDLVGWARTNSRSRGIHPIDSYGFLFRLKFYRNKKSPNKILSRPFLKSQAPAGNHNLNLSSMIAMAPTKGHLNDKWSDGTGEGLRVHNIEAILNVLRLAWYSEI